MSRHSPTEEERREQREQFEANESTFREERIKRENFVRKNLILVDHPAQLAEAAAAQAIREESERQAAAAAQAIREESERQEAAAQVTAVQAQREETVVTTKTQTPTGSPTASNRNRLMSAPVPAASTPTSKPTIGSRPEKEEVRGCCGWRPFM